VHAPLASTLPCSRPMDAHKLIAFVPAFALVALSPGLCMTLAMSLGISIGVRRTLWMMVGELAGVALVATAAMLGIAVILLQSPTVFTVFKFAGAAYLLYSAWGAWRADAPDPATVGALAARRSRAGLAAQGFLTAVGNPKAWAFLAALLPPFVDRGAALAPQLATLLVLIVAIEFSSLMVYAWGGRRLSGWLLGRGHSRLLNRTSAVLMLVVAIWLATS